MRLPSLHSESDGEEELNDQDETHTVRVVTRRDYLGRAVEWVHATPEAADSWRADVWRADP